MSDKIVQVSDLHICNSTARRLIAAFRTMKTQIQENTPIVIAGDIFNSKIRVTAHEINTLHQILQMLAPNPVHIIPGNHDFSYGDTDNLITTVLQGSNYPHVQVYTTHTLNYLGDSAVLFVVPNDYTDPMPRIRELTNVAGPRYLVVHEPISGCKYYTNTERPRITLQGLSVTAVMAGDIHKYGRHIVHNNVVVFSGSLVQKNASEYQDHGYVTWQGGDSLFRVIADPTRPLRFVHKHDMMVMEHSNKLSEITGDKRLVLVMKNCTRNYINTVVSCIRSDHGVDNDSISVLIRDKTPLSVTPNIPLEDSLPPTSPQDVPTFVPVSTTVSAHTNSTTNTPAGVIPDAPPTPPASPAPSNVDELRTHTKLLAAYLERTKNKIHTEAIAAMHGEYYNQIYLPGLTKKNKIVNWHMRYLVWENLYSYGPGNMVDFTTLTGLTSIIGRNGIGKSNLLRVLKFALFGTIEGTLCNVRAANWSVFAVFSCNNQEYMIKRNGTATAKTLASTQLNLYKINTMLNTCTNITRPALALTQNDINDMLGTEEQFVATHIIEPIRTSLCDEKQADITAMLTQGTHFDLFRDIRVVVDDLVKQRKKQITQLSERINKTRASMVTDGVSISDLHATKARLETEIITLDAQIAITPGLPTDLNLNNYTPPPITQEQRDDLVAQLEGLAAAEDSGNMPTIDAQLLRATNSSVTQGVLTTYKNLYSPGIEDLIRVTAANNHTVGDINDLLTIGAKYTRDQLVKLHSDAANQVIKLETIIRTLQLENYNADARATDQLPKWRAAAETVVQGLLAAEPVTDVVAELIALSDPLRRDNTPPHTYSDATGEPLPAISGVKTVHDTYLGMGAERIRNAMVWGKDCECCVKNQQIFTQNPATGTSPLVLARNARCMLYHILCVAVDLHQAKLTRRNKIANVLGVIELRSNPQTMAVLSTLVADTHTARYKYRDLVEKRQALKRVIGDERVALQSYRYLPEPLASMVNKVGIQGVRESITGLHNKRRKLQGELAATNTRIGGVDAVEKITLGLAEDERQLRMLSADMEKLQLYSSALDPETGIISDLLQEYVDILNGVVNNLLGTVSNFQLKLTLKKRDIVVTFQHNNRPIASASGAQRFIIDVIIRIALIRNSRTACNLLLIDEGFGSLDQNHIEQLTEFLQRLGEEYRLLGKCCMFISHIDDLNELSKNKLSISLKPTSCVTNVDSGQYIQISRRILGYAGEQAKDGVSYEADIQNDNGILTCKYCKKVQKTEAKARKHITTATHKKARDALITAELHAGN